MKKNKILMIALSLLLVSTEGFAQKWLKKIQEAAKTVEAALTTDDKPETAITNNEKAETAYVGDVEAPQQGRAFRLVTNHPDFKIKVLRCEVSGQTCVIDLLLENIGSTDVDIKRGRKLIAYDDEANEYTNIKMAIGDLNEWLYPFGGRTLLSEVPIKARIQIEGVKEAAKMFRRLDWGVECSTWGLERDKFVKFQNLPITREGDE